MRDRVPKYPGRVKLVPVTGQENTFDMLRADEPTQPGDPLSKATFLKDATAALLGLDENAVPDDAFSKIKNLIDAGIKIEMGSYVGTNTFGKNNPNTLRFGFAPKLLILFQGNNVASFEGYSEFQNYDAYAISCPALFSTNYTGGGVLNRASVNRWVHGTNGTGSGNQTVNFYSKRNEAGTEVSWYAECVAAGVTYDAAEVQMNYSNRTYNYLAIG